MSRDFINNYPAFLDHSKSKMPNTLDFLQCSPEFINYLLKAILQAPLNNENDRAVKTSLQRSLSEKMSNTLDFSQCSLEFINYLLKAISLAPVENQNDRALKTSLQRSLSEIMPDPQGYGANASR